MKFIKRLAKYLLPGLMTGLLVTSTVCATGAVWESCTVTADSAVEIYGQNWSAQTFTIGSEAHSVTELRLMLYRELLPGTVTVSIKATDTGDPVGADLCSGTIDGDTLTTDTAGSWYVVDVDDYSMEASTQYAIVVRAVAGDSTNSLWWKMDGSASTYAGGQEELSTGGGSTWTGDADDDYMFEIWGDNLIDVMKAEAYSGYREEGDLLVVCEYLNTYVPYYPDYDSSRYFDIQLRSANGATVLAQTVCKAWGDRPGSIYLNADAASSLTSGSAYRVYLHGDFTGNPSTYYTLQSADWRGTDFTWLDTWVLLTAHHMESYYGVALTEFQAEREVLNTEGGVLFMNGIPLLEEERPDLFSEILYIPGYEPSSGTEGWSSTSWETQVGTDMAAAINNAGTLFGMTGQRFGGLIIIGIYVILAVFLLPRGHSAAGMIAAAPLFFMGIWLRLVDAVFMGVMLSILAFFIIYHFWLRNTS